METSATIQNLDGFHISRESKEGEKMTPESIRAGHVYVNHNEERRVVGVYHPIAGIHASAFVEYTVPHEPRIKSMSLARFAQWAQESREGDTK